ncbi:haloacid dehalogenase-like hydrolase [Nostoc sp. NIES-4103]|nr:haloacid dehalogenase-like hydrolase [Nostoc sp. NIES-4103]
MEAVVLDIDGTLLESDATDDALYFRAVRQVLGNVKLRTSWGMYTQFTASGILTEILCDNAINVTPQTIAAVRECFVASVGNYISVRGPFTEVPGARAFVEALRNSAVHRVAYATGGWYGAAKLKLSTATFPVEGVPLSTSDDHSQRQGIMLHALQQLDGPFESVTEEGNRERATGNSFLFPFLGSHQAPPQGAMVLDGVTVPLQYLRSFPVKS